MAGEREKDGGVTMRCEGKKAERRKKGGEEKMQREAEERWK
jgi:hypothetical protein